MKEKTKGIVLITGLTLILLVSGIFAFNLEKNSFSPIYSSVLENKISVGIGEYYQGPVQEGYNETLFRETGRYEKEVISNDTK